VSAKAQGTLSGQASGTAGVTVGQTASIFSAEADIWGPSIAGSSSFANGTYTVRGSGSDIWNWSDQFHYVYTQVTGDSTIVTRVASMQNTQTYAKAGVMFRETLAPESRQADVVLKPDNQVSFQRRTATWGDTFQSAWQSVGTWLKLTRSGNTFTAYSSSDGVSWTTLGSDAIAMNATIYVGLAVCSHDNAQLNTATFANVSVTASAGASGAMALSADATTTTTATSARSADLLTTIDTTSAATLMNTDPTLTTSTSSTPNSTTPLVKVNVPLVTTTGKTVTKKTPTVRINVPVTRKIEPRKGDVPDVKTV
jgi:regulation of enolase protein 1 (concanavalin A-like superfamily)